MNGPVEKELFDSMMGLAIIFVGGWLFTVITFSNP